MAHGPVKSAFFEDGAIFPWPCLVFFSFWNSSCLDHFSCIISQLVGVVPQVLERFEGG